MNCVYKITFPELEAGNIYPCYYIGSKCNYTFDGTNVLDKFGKIYTGSLSSSYTEYYSSCVKTRHYIVEILAETEEDPRRLEREFQLEVNAVTNIKYFNKTYASDRRLYDAPGYGVYKHILTGKTVKLPVGHSIPEYVGINYDNILSVETKIKISNSCKEYWTEEKRKTQSIKAKANMTNGVAEKIRDSWTEEKRKTHSDKLKSTWTEDKRERFSIMSKDRNASPKFKEQFRKSKSRGTWILHEDELKQLWNALGKPGYIRFRKSAVEHGFNDESYQGAIRSWSNYYINRKTK